MITAVTLAFWAKATEAARRKRKERRKRGKSRRIIGIPDSI
jgi:hypothetical protein